MTIPFLRKWILLNLQSYIDDRITSNIVLVAISYDEIPDAPLELPFRRKRKASKEVGDGPSRTVKSPTKVVKTLATMRRPLGTILEAKDEGFENAKKDEESPTQNQPYGNSSIDETSLPSDQVVNTLSSSTPLQPTP